jgi:PLP dependent protein
MSLFLARLNDIQAKIRTAAEQAQRTSEEITLVAVSKGCSVQQIQEAYLQGLRNFGEGRVGEALEKMQQLPSDIKWHFVGKLQKNKVAKVIGHFAMIHSVDTLELAKKIDQASLKAHLITPVLVEVNISGEGTKGGFAPEELKDCFPEMLSYEGIKIDGLMTLAPFTKDQARIRQCFSTLRELAKKWELTILSMGMSNDFSLAIEEGATHVRIGTALFCVR